jgi:hypothetical protein
MGKTKTVSFKAQTKDIKRPEELNEYIKDIQISRSALCFPKFSNLKMQSVQNVSNSKEVKRHCPYRITRPHKTEKSTSQGEPFYSREIPAELMLNAEKM